MHVIRWHATHGRANRQIRADAPSTTTPIAHTLSEEALGDSVVPAAAMRDHSKSPVHTELVGTAQFARLTEPPPSPFLSTKPQLPTQMAATSPLAVIDEPSLRSPPLPAQGLLSLLSATSMTASFSLDDLEAREERRAAQRRRRGDVDRVLQIFEEVDAHFDSLQNLARHCALKTTTTATTVATAPAPLDASPTMPTQRQQQ
ncbi:hypothetical protein psal_cds_244 [Pandoravirus salinus]|uniref:Uncharacterized protein n=1 Tax=Pandoravirus salinus TaxID=1349410 RepID=S4VTX8_9VIRU|nr:hypothetical protein psal_cds_244 [Pandoravirus salinus]AGO83793.1 hypothetical protein psal_cds_244 [Pandoravirus salinus]